ncbi:carbohydrate kinase family protein [Sphaerisporangium sp. TRM90804]|uniref:carbohydrate kinase family protein n=1 Tax=Sphaerisporangium sp. TRM90804 TaxID=3031113 RepID=UPI00244C3FE6|nr:carbohydrate kinase family protein [Sphaerisporangium sp. TRM90804]MDH2429536.1 carbohydrate kinase family protein [Sphaerisporangium sp. TRM90804]
MNRDDRVVYDVVVVGGSGVDTTVYVPALPLPYADTHVVPPVVDRIGNTGSGVALGCHALGLRVKLVDLIGDDPQGALVRDHLAARGVEFGWAVVPEGTRRSVLLVGPDGRRTSLFDPRAAAGQRLPEELYRPAIRGARHVHVSITDFSRHLLPELRALGVPTSTDLHDWDGENDYHRDFAYSADLVFLSSAGLGDPSRVMRDVIARGRASLVVCTAGAAGSYLLAEGADEVRHVRAAPLPGPVRDSDGAGDAFVSAFLYGRLRGLPPEECARLGAVSGAHACTSEGTHENPADEDTLLGRAHGPSDAPGAGRAHGPR